MLKTTIRKENRHHVRVERMNRFENFTLHGMYILYNAMHLNINYDPNPSQSAFHSSNATYKGMVGALGSGKSSTLCVEGLALSLEYPGNVGLIARKTLPELRTTTMRRFLDYIPDNMVEKYNKSEREIYIRTGAKPSLVHFGPLDEINRYKSLELGWFAIDEADETSLDQWLVLCGRLRLKNVPLRGMLATNPTSPQHWIHDLFVKEMKPGYELFRSKTSDNAANLPPDYIKRLTDTYDEDWKRRYLDGEFGILQTGDPVFVDFRQKIHVAHLHQPTQGIDMVRGWDFGKRHPCVVFVQIDDLSRHRIYHTVKVENEDIYAFRDRILAISQKMYPTHRFVDYCDPSGKNEKDSGKSSISVLRERGIKPIHRMTSPGQRADEICKMLRESRGGEQMILIDDTPANQYLVEGFLGGYCVGEDGQPKKDGYYEHGIDAYGYVVANTCMTEREVTQSRIEIAEPKWSFGGRCR